MTDNVDPAPNSPGQAYMLAQAIEQFGAVGQGWIAEDTESYASAHPNSGITGDPLGAFAKVAESGLDVTFDTGEAFIGGAWLARDTQTTITLADDTSGQQVVVGWDYDGNDVVKIGVPGTAVGDTFDALDPRIPLYTFDTAAGAVSSETDDRVVGKTHDFDAAQLGTGSELARFLLTAMSDSVKGTAGNSTNELLRAGTDVSDMVMSVRADGRFNIAWNCYYDGSDWRYIVGSERAYKVGFGTGTGNDDLRLSTAPTGSADAVISWTSELGIDAQGEWRDQNNDVVYDGSNVPQSKQGGPAGNISQHPLAASDIADGSGSGLDADTVDGYEASTLQGGEGEWTIVDSLTDTDTTSRIAQSWGPYTTTYDLWRIAGKFSNFHDGSTRKFNECEVYINGDTDTVYQQSNIEGGTGVNVQENKNGWENLGKVECGEDDDGMFDVVIRGDALDSTANQNHPTIAAQYNAGTHDTYLLSHGVMRKDIASVNEFRLFSLEEAAGQFTLYGKNL